MALHEDLERGVIAIQDPARQRLIALGDER
jgi:hypothetical protein